MNKIADQTGILERIDRACSTIGILWDIGDSEDTAPASINTVITLLLKDGVSFAWLFSGRGLFWHSDTVEHMCMEVSADTLRYEYGIKALTL